MLIPKVTAAAALEPALQRAIALFPAVFYEEPQQLAIANVGGTSSWTAASSPKEALELLNSGLAVAVVDSADMAAEIGGDQARIAL
ncbi:hypothetical protein GGH99_005947, partial [Coemansia sp. RSA 1285]